MTAGEVSQRFKAQLVGDPGFLISGVADPGTAQPGSACLIASEDYLGSLRESQAGCWVIDPKLFERLDENAKDHKVFLVTEQPFFVFIQLISHFFPPPKAKAGVSPQACVHPEAVVH